jgi:hypothetical protein
MSSTSTFILGSYLVQGFLHQLHEHNDRVQPGPGDHHEHPIAQNAHRYYSAEDTRPLLCVHYPAQ